MPIDWDNISHTYADILSELMQLTPVAQWRIKPQKLQLTTHKTKYGMADIQGVVYINQAFIGSTAYQLLAATIRHELAHLCIGLEHGHDRFFKIKAKEFKADFGRHLQAEIDQVHAAIGYKYLLYATMEDQQELLFRRVHRKHAKYLNYKPSRFRYLTIKGNKVMAFRYQENQ